MNHHNSGGRTNCTHSSQRGVLYQLVSRVAANAVPGGADSTASMEATGAQQTDIGNGGAPFATPKKKKTATTAQTNPPGLLRLLPRVVVEQAVRVQPHELLLFVVHQRGGEELHQVEVRQQRDAEVDRRAADEVVVLQALALMRGQVDHQVDPLLAQVVQHVRALTLRCVNHQGFRHAAKRGGGGGGSGNADIFTGPVVGTVLYCGVGSLGCAREVCVGRKIPIIKRYSV